MTGRLRPKGFTLHILAAAAEHEVRIPKLRQGSYFPPFLEARKVSEKALIAAIQEAWIGGVSTRRVDDLVQAMGLSGISKSQVSKLCKDIARTQLAAGWLVCLVWCEACHHRAPADLQAIIDAGRATAL